MLHYLKKEAGSNIQSNYESYKKVALDIWNFAESGFKENKSSTLLQNTLTGEWIYWWKQVWRVCLLLL
jgi:metal-dependent amidase/aminoacylase/carboxypeptidase family protein